LNKPRSYHDCNFRETRKYSTTNHPHQSLSSSEDDWNIMSAQQSQGIQALLDAEKEAARIVEKAREYRSQKLKEARGEAAKEIDSLKSKREEEFKEFEQQHSGNTDSQQKALEEETKKHIEVIKAEFNKNKAKVVSDLLAKVTDVQPELHQNYKLGIHQSK